QTYNDAVTLSFGAALTSFGGGTISFASTVDNGGGDLIVNTDGTGTFSGVISNSGGLQQNGSGTTTLAAVNSYTDATEVNAGTLLVDGQNIVSDTTVASGGTLGGVGITSVVSITDGGTLSPGESTGTTTGTLSAAGDVSFAS